MRGRRVDRGIDRVRVAVHAPQLGIGALRAGMDYCCYDRPQRYPVISLAYVSATRSPLSEEEIVAILMQSRANNTRNGVTGALLYERGRFVQILEGDEERVLRLYRTISRDQRHGDIHELSRQVVQTRQFPQWTMGFRPLTRTGMKKLDGFDANFGRTGTVQIKHADPAAQLFLEWLGEYWFSAA